MLDTHRMWLLALDTITGRPRTRTMVTAVAATLLLELVDRDIAACTGDEVIARETPTPDWTTVLEFGRSRILQSSTPMRASDAIDLLHTQVWNTVGRDLAANGISRQRHLRGPRRNPRWELPDPTVRVDVVRTLRHALRSPATLDPTSHRLAAVLWATDTAEHGLSENSLLNDAGAAALADAMAHDPLALRITQAVAYLISPAATIGGNPTLY